MSPSPPTPFPHIASGFCSLAEKKIHEMKANLKADVRVDGDERGREESGGVGVDGG